MVLKQLAREYERKRQKMLMFLRKDLDQHKIAEIQAQIGEIQGIIEFLRTAESAKQVYDHYSRRIASLMKSRKNTCVVRELRNFVQALVYAEETKNNIEVPLRGTKFKHSRDLKKEYQTKVKPLIDDFLEEDY